MNIGSALVDPDQSEFAAVSRPTIYDIETLIEIFRDIEAIISDRLLVIEQTVRLIGILS